MTSQEFEQNTCYLKSDTLPGKPVKEGRKTFRNLSGGDGKRVLAEFGTIRDGALFNFCVT